MRWGGAVAFAFALALAACGLSVEGVAGLAPADDESEAGTPRQDGSSDSGATRRDANDGADAGADGATPGDAASDGPVAFSCKGTAGPTPVRVGTFCIDRTEVTRAQYAAFVAAPKAGSQPSYCAWNNSFGSIPSPDDLPVTDVDWCDARAFCAWAGKRLCTVTEARAACGSGGSKYPYGGTYIAGRCNDATLASGGPVPVASLTCNSALGVHDMIGNVWEWIDECSASNGPNDDCSFSTGGAWNHTYDCDVTATGFKRQSRAADVGFRCCSEPNWRFSSRSGRCWFHLPSRRRLDRSSTCRTTCTTSGRRWLRPDTGRCCSCAC